MQFYPAINAAILGISVCDSQTRLTSSDLLRLKWAPFLLIHLGPEIYNCSCSSDADKGGYLVVDYQALRTPGVLIGTLNLFAVEVEVSYMHGQPM